MFFYVEISFTAGWDNIIRKKPILQFLEIYMVTALREAYPIDTQIVITAL